MAYDAFGRNVFIATSNPDGVTNRMDFLEYDQSGNVVRRVTDLMDGRVAEATAEYDMLNREVRRTDALGHVTETAYDALGRTVSTSGDGTAYAYSYDDSLLCTNEAATNGEDDFTITRTYDGFLRSEETSVMVTNVRHSAKVRLYDSESRVCGYALTNAAGRGVSVSLAYDGSYVTNTVYTLPNGSSFSARLSREAGRRDLVTRRDYFFGGQSIS